MPRRQQPFGKPLKPRGRRGTAKPAQPQPQIVIKGRNAKAVAAELIKHAERQENKSAAKNDRLAKTGAFRNRHVLPLFGWLAGTIVAGLILAAFPPVWLWSTIGGGVIGGIIYWCTRGDRTPPFTQKAGTVAGTLTSLWVPLISCLGLRTVLWPLAGCWVICAAIWMHHYRIRPAEPLPEVPDVNSDKAKFAELCEQKGWKATLANLVEIPGGRTWEIQTDGIKTHIGNIMTEPRAIPAAWHKARTEAYVEPHSSAVESRGSLTLLNQGTLENVVAWNGEGFGPDGIGRLGRFADGKPVRVRVWNPRNGTVHSLIAGCTGAGKSVCLDDLIWMALATEAETGVKIVPIILDPQNGQSLPQWQGKVLYAAGMDECVRYTRAIDAALDDRSRRMASLIWDDNGHRVKGMNFFDPHLSKLPIIMPIYEEAPQLLGGDGNSKLGTEMTQKVGKQGKLARKAGEAMELVTQIPSLAELGNSQALRAMLAGGNVISLRTAERVTSGMLGLDADPSSLPKYFPNGEPTGGLGYVVAVDNRQAPMRLDRPDRDPRHEEWPMVLPDDGWMEAMNRVLDKVSPTATVAPTRPKPVAQPLRPVAAVPEPPAEDEPEGRRCVDAVWQVLTTDGGEMDRGLIAADVNVLVTTDPDWKRDKGFSVRIIGEVLGELVDGKHKHEGREATKPKRGVYQAVTQENQEGKAA